MGLLTPSCPQTPNRGKKPKDFSGRSPGMERGRHGTRRLTLTSLSNRISFRVSPLLSLETQPSVPLLPCFISYLTGPFHGLSPASLCPLSSSAQVTFMTVQCSPLGSQDDSIARPLRSWPLSLSFSGTQFVVYKMG